MSNFMEGYEDVAARVKRWQIAFPVGRIETDVVWHDAAKSQVLVKASVYREHEDTLVAAIDWAFGDSTNYPQNMRKWYLEDTVTSAIGRAISLVLESDHKPTKQDMAKVEYVTNKPFADKLQDKITVEVADDPWINKDIEPAKTIDEAVDMVKSILNVKSSSANPSCEHGERIWATGTSKAGKPWGMMKCTLIPAKQCAPIWYEIKADGSWGAQENKY